VLGCCGHNETAAEGKARKHGEWRRTPSFSNHMTWRAGCTRAMGSTTGMSKYREERSREATDVQLPQVLVLSLTFRIADAHELQALILILDRH
jgi:hypothetical protein